MNTKQFSLYINKFFIQSVFTNKCLAIPKADILLLYLCFTATLYYCVILEYSCQNMLKQTILKIRKNCQKTYLYRHTFKVPIYLYFKNSCTQQREIAMKSKIVSTIENKLKAESNNILLKLVIQYQTTLVFHQKYSVIQQDLFETGVKTLVHKFFLSKQDRENWECHGMVVFTSAWRSRGPQFKHLYFSCFI